MKHGMPFSPEELDLAVRSLSSTIRKNEKVYETLSRKETLRPGQLRLAAEQIADHRLMLALMQGEAQLSEADLERLPQVIHRYVEKVRAVLPKFAPGTSQHTLAVRRIAAYEMALEFTKSSHFSPLIFQNDSEL